jgi:hypothetical protein
MSTSNKLDLALAKLKEEGHEIGAKGTAAKLEIPAVPVRKTQPSAPETPLVRLSAPVTR